MKNSSQNEIDAYEQLQTDFSRLSWLTYFDFFKILYADIDASNKDFEVMIYHRKKDSSEQFSKSSKKKEVDFIFFFFKMLTEAESKYWSIKLEMIVLIWTIRRIVYMIKSFRHSTVIYTDYEVNSVIAAKTKLSTINIIS